MNNQDSKPTRRSYLSYVKFQPVIQVIKEKSVDEVTRV